MAREQAHEESRLKEGQEEDQVEDLILPDYTPDRLRGCLDNAKGAGIFARHDSLKNAPNGYGYEVLAQLVSTV